MINQFPKISRVKLLPEVFPPGSLRSRLPKHFKDKYLAKLETRPGVRHQEPYEAKYRIDAETGFRIPIQDPPVRTIRPASYDRALFGGERVIYGYEKDQPNTVNGPFTKVDDSQHKKCPHFWFPVYKTHMFFSEILDRYIQVPVTDTTLDAVDAKNGFDLYILETDVVNLDSRTGELLKKEMMTRLWAGEAGPNGADAETRKNIFDKYKEHLLPIEEVEWLGLTIAEACAKQMKIEEKTVDNNLIPLKFAFAKKVYDELKYESEALEVEDDRGLMGKFKPRS